MLQYLFHLYDSWHDLAAMIANMTKCASIACGKVYTSHAVVCVLLVSSTTAWAWPKFTNIYWQLKWSSLVPFMHMVYALLYAMSFDCIYNL